jgi:hypothetical protein
LVFSSGLTKEPSQYIGPFGYRELNPQNAMLHE